MTATDRRRIRRWLSILLVACAWSSLAACGGEDTTDGTGEPAAVTKEPGETPSDKFMCANEVCELPKGLTGDLCCADPFSGGCGVKRGDECRRLPKRDERCPDITASASIRGVPCCAQNDECGIDIGVGCLSTVENCSLYPRSVVVQLGRQTCDGEKLELAADCGRPDVGGAP